ncbi:efflux RND transporter periplasmic adaptor subunit [Parapedobacter indicus]|uniref:RND family efflux transporter, MFP subunit n=1 Tax=Parapedobacter indicus TaxID=1477437 RepID=A0A1I3IH35_9SPHI|nr:efflux RND transporter periplasmic adaptor subunit [Parapedobacter indicus]PPL02169.1 RND family efflux transporter MFP subunit [Parapedobacter indicus]SFI47355.1 RND family efflux transporter, MFP subunit [Parapedobacter indicus]
MKTQLILFTGLLTLLTACGGPRGESEEHEHGHSEHESENTQASVTEEQSKSIGLQLGNIEQKALTATLRVNGTVNVPNANRAVITSLYGGVIKKLNVDVGDAVKKDEVIATLVHPQFIQLQEEYLNLADQLLLAEQEWNRQQLLAEGKVGAQKDLQQAEVEYNKLKIRQTSLRAQLQLMGVDVNSINSSRLWSTLPIKSPVNGVVGDVFAKQGSFVDVSAPLAEVIENSRLHVDLNVFEKDLPNLKVGQQIHFVQTNNPTKNYDAEIYAIGAAFENDSKSIPVHCTVSGDKTGLIDGMNVSALISLDNVMSMAVPDEAIVDAQGKSYIFVVTDTSTEQQASVTHFERIEVVKGTADMGYTAITPVRTLDEANQIAVKGAFFINAILSGTAGHSH